MAIPVEDNFSDVIGKAQRGLSISDSELADRAGISLAAVQKLRSGEFDDSSEAKVAPVLGLNAQALVSLPHYRPEPIHLEGLAQFNTPFDDMTVNAYLVWDRTSKEAAAFDTGSDCSPILDFLKEHGLVLRHIFITHTHGDHVYDLDRFIEKTGAQAHVSSRETIHGAKAFHPGAGFQCGSLKIETRSTWGHSKGGTTYVVQGLELPVAVVGDALFAGSMGGGMVSYRDALSTNRKEIFSLSDESVICPGHGPLTTVGAERQNNPFFA
jgi:glyoxylase-like metal-dependent hydrolase (beta-lactamase superfamily II)